MAISAGRVYFADRTSHDGRAPLQIPGLSLMRSQPVVVEQRHDYLQLLRAGRCEALLCYVELIDVKTQCRKNQVERIEEQRQRQMSQEERAV